MTRALLAARTGRAFFSARLGRALACAAVACAALVSGACQNKAATERPRVVAAAPLAKGDPAPFLAGRWETAPGAEDGPATLEFRLPAEVESTDAAGRRNGGKFVFSSPAKLRLYFPAPDGRTVEVPLAVAKDQDRLSFVDTRGKQSWYERAPEPAKPEPIEDSRWLSGSWQRGTEREWLLFNPPSEVGLLKGKPAALVAHGKYSAHGNYISVLLPNLTLELEADEQRRTLATSFVPQQIYARGVAP